MAKQSALKSAAELVMERLSRQAGTVSALTDDQKKALAEVDRKTKAKRAELEIMHHDRRVRTQAEPEQLEKIEAEHRAEIEKIKSRAEEEKEKIRGQPAAK